MLVDETKRAIERQQGSIAKIDAARARKLGMMVTEAYELEEPKEILLDIAAQNPAEMLASYKAKQAKFVTSPFDPEGRKLRFYPGGYTVWSGFPGAGKSTILRQAICHWLHNNQGVFVASLEEHPRDLLIRIAATAFGVDPDFMTEKQLQYFCDFYQDSLRIWGMIGVSSHRKILSVAQELSKHGVTQVVVDSLMRLDIDSSQYEQQRQFSNLLSTVNQTCQIHTHLVAHPRKSIESDQDAHINDVGGAKEIVANADNAIFIRRGKEQEDQILCGMKIAIRKQRHGSGAIGDITGWFNRRLRQFKIDQFDDYPTKYLPKEAYAS